MAFPQENIVWYIIHNEMAFHQENIIWYIIHNDMALKTNTYYDIAK
jgi:hypothetical protein